jgi:hypothetical protein
MCLGHPPNRSQRSDDRVRLFGFSSTRRTDVVTRILHAPGAGGMLLMSVHTDLSAVAPARGQAEGATTIVG